MFHHLPESFCLASFLAEQGVHHRKDSESEWLAKDNLEANPITIKPKTLSHVAELFSWVPLPYWSPLRCPFPIKSLALSAHVSPRTIHFRVRQEPSFRPWKGSPFLQQRLQPVTKVTTSWSFLIFCNFKDDLKSFQCPYMFWPSLHEPLTFVFR